VIVIKVIAQFFKFLFVSSFIFIKNLTL